jgi:hypothetical protein
VKEPLRLPGFPGLEIAQPSLHRADLPVVSLADELRLCVDVKDAITANLLAMKVYQRMLLLTYPNDGLRR